MFPHLPARATFVVDKFCFRDTKNVSDFVQKHFVSPRNVSQFAEPKKHHGQQCVRNKVSRLNQGLKISYWFLYSIIPCNNFTISLEGYCAFTEGGFNLHVRFLNSSSLGSRELLAESRRGTFAALLATGAPETFAAAVNVFDNRGGLSDALTPKLPFVFAFPSKPCCWCIPVRSRC